MDHFYRCSGCGLEPRSIRAGNPEHAARLFRMDLTQWGGKSGTIEVRTERGLPHAGTRGRALMRTRDSVRDGVEDLEEHRLRERCNPDGSAVTVRHFVDVQARTAYLVDDRNKLYREARLGQGVVEFGPWLPLGD